MAAITGAPLPSNRATGPSRALCRPMTAAAGLLSTGCASTEKRSMGGRLGTKKINWYGWTEQIDGTPVLMREAVVKDFFRESGRDSNPDLEELLLHVWVYGASEHEVRALQDAVATLTKLQ